MKLQWGTDREINENQKSEQQTSERLSFFRIAKDCWLNQRHTRVRLRSRFIRTWYQLFQFAFFILLAAWSTWYHHEKTREIVVG